MPTALSLRSLLAIAALLWLAACAMPEVKPPPKPEPPPPDPRIALAAKADAAYDRGVKEYDAGNFDASIKEFQASLDFGVMATPKQLEARKTIAFSHCLQKRLPECRAEFRKILEISPNFELKPTEVGHPDWGSVFKTERDRVLADLLEERRRQELARLPLPERLLADGLYRYEAGEYATALKLLQDAVKEGLANKDDRLRAIKHSAFCYCLDNKQRECRAEFHKLFDIDHDFDLTVAEAGHPSWGRVFAQVKREAKAAAAKKVDPKKAAPAATPGKPAADAKSAPAKPAIDPKASPAKPATDPKAAPAKAPADPKAAATKPAADAKSPAPKPAADKAAKPGSDGKAPAKSSGDAKADGAKGEVDTKASAAKPDPAPSEQKATPPKSPGS